MARKKQQILLEAKKMFVDAIGYNEYELVGYYRLVKIACKKIKEVPSGKICILNIQNILKTLDKRRLDILRWRYWDGIVRHTIGERMGISGERVRQLESRALELIEYELKRILGDRSSVEILNLKIRSYLALKRVGINTIEQLVKLTPKELSEISGIGTDCFNDIKQKLVNYVQCSDWETEETSDDKPIDVFRFSIRLENALKKAGVINVKQLFSMSNEELYKINGVGLKGLKQIIKVKPKETPELNIQKIDTLGLSNRVVNALKREGILSVERFLGMPLEEIYLIKGIGKKCIDEIELKRREYISNNGAGG